VRRKNRTKSASRDRSDFVFTRWHERLGLSRSAQNPQSALWWDRWSSGVGAAPRRGGTSSLLAHRWDERPALQACLRDAAIVIVSATGHHPEAGQIV